MELIASQCLSIELRVFLKEYFILSLICTSVASFSMISILSHNFPSLKYFLMKNHIWLIGFVLFVLSKLVWIDFLNSSLRQLLHSNSLLYSCLDPAIPLGFIALLSTELISLHLVGVIKTHMLEKSVFIIMNIAGLCLSLWLMIAKSHYVHTCYGNLAIAIDEYGSCDDVTAVYFSLSSSVVGVVAVNGLSLTLFNYNVVDRLIKVVIQAMSITISLLSTLISVIVQHAVIPLLPLIMKCLRYASRSIICMIVQVSIQLRMIMNHIVLDLIPLLDRNCRWIWRTVVRPTIDAVMQLSIQLGKLIHNAAVVSCKMMSCSCRWIWNNVVRPVMTSMQQLLVMIGNGLHHSAVTVSGWLDSGSRWIWNSVISPTTAVMVNIYYVQRIYVFVLYKLVVKDICDQCYLIITEHTVWLWSHYIRHIVVNLMNISTYLLRITINTIYYFLLPSLMLCIAFDGMDLMRSIFADTHQISMVPVGLFVGGEDTDTYSHVCLMMSCYIAKLIILC